MLFYFLFFCFLFFGVLFLKDIEEHKLRKRERESFKVVQKLFFGGTENRSSEINGKKKKKDGICFVWKILKLKGLLVPRLNQQIHTHREAHIRHRDIERDTHTSGFSLCLSLCLRQYCIFNGLQLDSHPNLFMSHIFVGQGMFVLC